MPPLSSRDEAGTLAVLLLPLLPLAERASEAAEPAGEPSRPPAGGGLPCSEAITGAVCWQKGPAVSTGGCEQSGGGVHARAASDYAAAAGAQARLQPPKADIAGPSSKLEHGGSSEALRSR